MANTKPSQFDADGRDPALVETYRWHAENTGTTFDRQAVPVGVTDAEWWRELMKAIAADPRSSGAAFIERNSRRPDYGLTASQRWGREQRRKKEFMKAVSGVNQE